jgi:hypothetical protein
MEKIIRQRNDSRPQQAQLLLPGNTLQFFLGQGWSQVGLQPAADVDIGDKQRGQQKALENTGQPQLAYGLTGDHAVQHQDHTGGHHNPQ